MKSIAIVVILVVFITGCKKNYDAEGTYAKAVIAATWAKQESFYSPNPEVFIDSISTWRKFNSFSFTSAGEPDKIGFANPYNAGKGTNALYMNSLYSSQSLTSDSGYYNVTIAKCFEFIPKATDNLTEGIVKVIPQKVTLTRKDKTSFQIGIFEGTTPGTYNTATGVFEIEVGFDETSIGGPAVVKRKYRFKA